MTCRHYQSKGDYREHGQWFIECDCVQRYFYTEADRDNHIKQFCRGADHKCPVRRGQDLRPSKPRGGKP